MSDISPSAALPAPNILDQRELRKGRSPRIQGILG